MTKKSHISETPATRFLRTHGVVFAEYTYDWEPHGGARAAAHQLGLDAHCVIKTLVMQDLAAQPLVVLMHGDFQVSTKNLARQIGAKNVQPCTPEVASRHSGYQVGGTSPFGTRRAMPVFVESSVLQLPQIAINGGRRGYLLWLEPHLCMHLLGAQPVQCALAE